MLGLAKRTNSKIFQASTSEVYGDPEISPQSESYTGKVNTLVFPLEEGALISKVPPPESAVNFIELMLISP